MNGVCKASYRRKVHALKIAKVEPTMDGALLTPEDSGCLPFNVSQRFVDKHDPQAGGWYLYYGSLEPSNPHESGYSLIE